MSMAKTRAAAPPPTTKLVSSTRDARRQLDARIFSNQIRRLRVARMARFARAPEPERRAAKFAALAAASRL